MKSAPILVVGSFVQDLTFSTARFPSPGETVVGEFITGPGGKGSNQAVAARRAGSEVIYVGAVGRDAFASEVRKFYQTEGIVAHLAEYAEKATGTAGILFDESGENEIVVALGANADLSPSDISDDDVASAGLLVCQLECNLDAVADVMKRTGEKGIKRILNPAPLRPDLPVELIHMADFLIPNESEFVAVLKKLGIESLPTDEIATLSGEELDSLCRKVGTETVLVTLGGNGAHLSTENFWERIPAEEGVVPVDTTGAGDAFVGAFSAGLQRFDNDPLKAAQFANRAAAISVTRKGTAPAMATLEEIEG
ncbi:MAG: ribokinase [Verrucomicrobiota bacterium]